MTRYTLHRNLDDEHGEVLSVDGTMDCGRTFENVVTIIEPTSPNPGLRINNPSATMGVTGLAEIVTLVRQFQAEQN